ncbi:MAG: DEAD/DEAH box helicase family protein [Aeromicrobium sp.]|uniref:DEAD/DEAH box helicase n=1 Tax=Aeromicrobium sp. TaxID=1871063 RepID=UPI00262E0523|nr:DEAD/DEAH box helicase family protein [Aeromicrobium sp.]MDF1704639.1 DEAD/DEAH box helicase family protein [Aeromicrobium sp.]
MKFDLEAFQAEAARVVASRIRRARRDYAEDGEITAVGLTAPTGAGKTVIATAVLEDLFFGAGEIEPDPDLTVLWVTDDRSLNRQTIAKINQASDRLDHHHFGFLGDEDAPTLAAGRIHFVHIQQLQKNSTLHARRDGRAVDHRTHGAWDMIAATVRERGKDLVVIVDEAHRGTGTARDRGTIVGTIINGGTTNIGTAQPPAPVVLGISATPEKFVAAMGQANRSLKRYDVPASEVRASGLLKDRILIMPLAEDQSATHTMLQLAVDDLRAFTQAWADRHARVGGRKVDPILVVQVEPGVTDARLDEYLSSIESAWPELTGFGVAHAFGDPHGPLSIGDRVVRYLAPEAIESDDAVRVVLFKSALTTGWDCPRAEVLVSFQAKESYTEIAQLIGRLVRTPLASRAEDVELLDSVVAYLPGFRLEHVVKVVHALTSDQSVESDVVIEPAVCRRAPILSGEVLQTLESLVSFRRDTAQSLSATSRMLQLAVELTGERVLEDATKTARAHVVMDVAREAVLRRAELDAKVNDLLSVELGLVDVYLGPEVMQSHATRTALVNERDIDAYFDRARRRLPDASATWIYRSLCEEGATDHEAKVRVAAMAALGFADHVESSAATVIRRWRSTYRSQIDRRDRAVRDRIEPLWNVGAGGLIEGRLVLPEVRREATVRVDGSGAAALALWPKHGFQISEGEAAGTFPAAVTGWEREVLERELAESDLLAWIRNPPSGAHALAVPYSVGEETGLMHPDFLFLYGDGSDVVVDIVDPHRHDLADTGPKWRGLAQYALDHPDHLRRVVAVIRDSSGALRGLDLRSEGMVEQLRVVYDKAGIEALFAEQGFDY